MPLTMCRTSVSLQNHSAYRTKSQSTFRIPIFRTLLTIALFLTVSNRVTSAVNIPSGFDFFITDIGESSVDVPVFGTVPLKGNPSGLYPGGEWVKPSTIPVPVPPQFLSVTWFDMHGNQVSEDSVHKVNQTATPLYDTVVQRIDPVLISGIGSEEKTQIQMIWLSLMSEPIPLGGDIYEIFVGLHDSDGNPDTVDQHNGQMKLISTTSDGHSGLLDIGRKGATTDDFTDPSFLGLPVTYDILIFKNAILFSENTGEAVFHGNTQSPSGTYSVPDTGTSAVLTGMMLAVVALAKKLPLNRLNQTR